MKNLGPERRQNTILVSLGGEGWPASEKKKRQERRVVLFEWMRRGRGPLAEGLPRVRSPLPRTVSAVVGPS